MLRVLLRKVEDLQFLLEEMSIEKAHAEVTTFWHLFCYRRWFSFWSDVKLHVTIILSFINVQCFQTVFLDSQIIFLEGGDLF